MVTGYSDFKMGARVERIFVLVVGLVCLGAGVVSGLMIAAAWL